MFHLAKTLEWKAIAQGLVLGLAMVLLWSLLSGCGNDDDDDDDEKGPAATSVTATPPSGSTISPNITLILSFDNPPLDVTVNRTPANLAGRTATWIATDLVPGPATLMVTWTNMDGSLGSATLSYTVVPVGEQDTQPPFITEATIPRLAGIWSTQVDPQLLKDGITIRFSEAVTPGEIDISAIVYDETTHTEERRSLAWSSTWNAYWVTIAPSDGSRALVLNQLYHILIEGVADIAGNPLEETEITFGTFAVGSGTSGKRVLR